MKDLLLDEASISSKIASITESFSCGSDGVPASVVKRCGLSLSPVLCYLFNLSIRCGVFPSMWKMSLILPLHKKGRRDDISNYRPIANLPCFAKLFESLIYDALYFHSKPFLGSFQHGFRRGKSTASNLVEFTNFCTSNLEQGKQVDCIYTDFSKAFDRLNHQLLLYKLKLLGFPPLFVGWLSSYLSNRSQRVIFRSSLSKEVKIESGVPQGSHLGPLLFIIFINDIISAVPHSKILCYADDAKIFRVISNSSDCVALNSDLTLFNNWCHRNFLPLNISKCSVMSFARNKNPLHFVYEVGGSSLARLDKCRDLGVIFNPQLSFADHIDSVVLKANATLGFVKRWSREFRDPYICKQLYCALVRPILEYACPVWSPYHLSEIKRLESVQRRFLRFALGSLPWSDPFNLPPYSDRLKLIGLTSLEKRREISKTTFLFDLLQGSINSPELLDNISISVPTRSLRSSDFLHVSFHRTNYGKNMPLPSMSRLFNFYYKDCIDFNLSKTQLKSLLY